jgi:uncharacterized protein YjbJ (UPF0337 family)
MNEEQVKGAFDQIRGKIKETWGRLSDDDVALANGKREAFFGRLQQTYGLAKEDAEKRLEEIEKSCHHDSNKAA